MTASADKTAVPTSAPGDRSTPAVPVWSQPQDPGQPPPPVPNAEPAHPGDASEDSEQLEDSEQPEESGQPQESERPEDSEGPERADAKKQREGTQAGADVSFEAADAVPRALQIVGSIVAPTTLVTALFLYFGLLYAVAYFRYFGVNYTVLELPNRGFLILSASAATLPLALLAAAALLSLWLYQVPYEKASGTAHRLLHFGLLPAVAAVGVGLLALVVTDALFATRLFPTGFWEARGLSLSVGVVLLAYAGRLRRMLGPPKSAGRTRPHAPVVLTVGKWVCLSLLFGVGLFWAVGSYALRMGTEGAEGHVAGLRCAPDVVLYSEKSLNLQYAGVREEAVVGSDGASGYRYPGLKLVPQEGTQYLLLPADWAQNARPAILLPRSDALRLEFVTVPSGAPGTC
jgi:hypothetical protein